VLFPRESCPHQSAIAMSISSLAAALVFKRPAVSWNNWASSYTGRRRELVGSGAALSSWATKSSSGTESVICLRARFVARPTGRSVCVSQGKLEQSFHGPARATNQTDDAFENQEANCGTASARVIPSSFHPSVHSTPATAEFTASISAPKSLPSLPLFL
jgi:hypothetical protein